jgi:putative transposase
MVVPSHNKLSISIQCKLLTISRSSWYYKPKGENSFNLNLMRLIDIQYLQTPFYGSRQMARHLCREGFCVGRKRIRRLMSLMGIEAIYQKPRTSTPHPEHKVYPYLLKGLAIDRPNQVWCSDITYIPMPMGFMYLVSVMDWSSRKVLSWRLSNTLNSDFCVEALKAAISSYGKPEIFNTDQGSQFTSIDFTDVLIDAGIKISMDGKGRWLDNVFIERLWKSLKYECVYLNYFKTAKELKQGLTSWLDFYNKNRPHSSLDGQTPNEVYFKSSSDYNLMMINAA